MGRSLKSRIAAANRKNLKALQNEVLQKQVTGQYVDEKTAWSLIQLKGFLVHAENGESMFFFKDQEDASRIKRSFEVYNPQYLSGDKVVHNYVFTPQVIDIEEQGNQSELYSIPVSPALITKLLADPGFSKQHIYPNKVSLDLPLNDLDQYISDPSKFVVPEAVESLLSEITSKSIPVKKDRKEEVVKTIIKSGVVSLLYDNQASVFFRDPNTRNAVLKELDALNLTASKKSSNFKGRDQYDYHTNEASLYEIRIDPDFAASVIEHPDFPSTRVTNWGAPIGPNEKVINTLRSFRASDRNQAEWTERQAQKALKRTNIPVDDAITRILEDGVIGLREDGRIVVFFDQRSEAKSVFFSLKNQSPASLSDNDNGQIDTIKYASNIGELYQLTFSPEFGEQLLNDPRLKSDLLMARGFPIQKSDVISEVASIYSAIKSKDVKVEPMPTFTYQPIGQLSSPAPEDFNDFTKPAAKTEPQSPPLNNLQIAEIAVGAATATSIIADVTQSTTPPLTEEHSDAKPMLSVPVEDSNTALEKVLPQHIESKALEKENVMALPEQELPIEPQTNIPVPDQYKGYAEYLASFGFMLKEHRENRKMSRDQVAEVVSQKLDSGEKITANNIQYWEQARGQLPTDAQFNALATVLIDENQNITDKEKAREEFKTAYTKSMAAKNAGGTEDDQYLFADNLTKLREALVVTIAPTRDKFAALIEEKLQTPLPPEEAKLLEQHKGKFIAGIEAGIVKPSKHLMLALVKAIDAQGTLEEEQKMALYEAYDKIPDKAIELTRKIIHLGNGRPTVVGSNGAVHNNHNGHASADGSHATSGARTKHRGRHRLSEEEPDDPIMKIKFKLRKLVNKDDTSLNQLAKASGINPNILGTVVSSTADPVKFGGFSTNTHAKFVEHIRTIYPDDEVAKTAEFEALYSELKEKCLEARNRGPSVE